MRSARRLIHFAAFLAALLFAGQCSAETVIARIPQAEPVGVDVNPLTRLVYVADFFAPTVSVISERTNTVVDTITFPSDSKGPAELLGVAVNPITSRLYATNPRSGLVYVVDLRNKTIIKQIFVGSSNEITVNFRTNKVYVNQFFAGNVVVIDGNTNTIRNTIPIPSAQKVSVDIVTNRAYVAEQDFFGAVFVLDGASDAVLARIPTGNFTTSVGIDFLRHLAYASNDGFTAATSSVSVIDTRTNTVVDTIVTDPGPTPVAVNPFTNRIYVATTFQSSDVVDVIDGRTRKVVNTLPIDPQPQFMAIDFFHGRLFVSCFNAVIGVPGGNVETVIRTSEPEDSDDSGDQ